MTRPFRIDQLKANSVAELRNLWPAIDFDPTYQRRDDVWEKTKQQLFIDSLINGYDIPKLYFHDLSWRERGPNKRYAIIDGKQRLRAIQDFIGGSFPLSDEFEDIEEEVQDKAGAAAGLRYLELSAKYPNLKARLDQARLPIVLVQTRGESTLDLEWIEEMFSRLNEAVPLNAPEKRNALGGPLPRQIRRLAADSFFSSRLAFPNARYRHLDLAAKFLYMEYRGGLTDLKKRDLDNFVKEFKAQRWDDRAAALQTKCTTVLKRMARLFVEADPLLTSVGMVTIYYQLFREAAQEGWLAKIERSRLLSFEDERAQNRSRVKEAQELALEGKRSAGARDINPVLVAFERFVQSPNDVTALTRRLAVLRHFIREGAIPASDDAAD